MGTEDLSSWYPKSEAAHLLGISERTLDRLVADGRGPECRKRPRPGKKPEPVYKPEDVDALRAAANQPHVIAASSALMPRSPAGAPASIDGDIPPGLALALGLIERLVQIGQKPALEAPRTTEKLWLTISEAAEYSGLSEVFLRRLVRSGQLPAVRDGGYKVKRADLDSIDALSPLAASLAVAVVGGNDKRTL